MATGSAPAFVDIWRAWDEKMAAMPQWPRRPPANYGQTETERLLNATKVLAAEADVPLLVLQRRMSEQRRAGKSYDESLTAALRR